MTELHDEHLSLALALIVLLGVGAQWVAWRIRAPAIILMALFGLLAGPVAGWLRPAEQFGPLLDPIIRLGVAVILFEGGLSLRFTELRQAATGVKRLVSFGVGLAFVLGSAAAHYFGNLSWPVAMVFGAISVVTGPTVIMPLLRQARLRKRPASFLKWEGIINDPIGALLAVLVFQYSAYAGAADISELLVWLGEGLAVAGLLGVGGGYLLGSAYRRGYAPEYLKGPIAFVAAVMVYVAANYALSEAGLLATTLLGVTLGNMRLPSIGEIRRYKEYVTIMLVSAVFVLLTAELDPQILLTLDWHSAALLLAMLFLVRPLSVFLATVGTDMSWQERLLVGWIAPRGIVAAAMAGVFAPQLFAHGYQGAGLLLPLVFALIFLTVLVHGLSLGALARRLKLSATGRHGVLIVGASSWTVGLAGALKELGVFVLVVDASWHRLRIARLAGIAVHYGEILSEFSEETLEFSEIGYLFAATDNDAYNSLVCSRFAPDLGRNRVYQLPYITAGESDPKRLPRTVRGLVSPDEEALYEDLLRRWYGGWTFQKTQLTETFTYERFVDGRPQGSLPIVVLKEGGDIQFESPEQRIKPRPGDLVIWFGPKPEKKVPGHAVEEDAGEPEDTVAGAHHGERLAERPEPVD